MIFCDYVMFIYVVFINTMKYENVGLFCIQSCTLNPDWMNRMNISMRVCELLCFEAKRTQFFATFSRKVLHCDDLVATISFRQRTLRFRRKVCQIYARIFFPSFRLELFCVKSLMQQSMTMVTYNSSMLPIS